MDKPSLRAIKREATAQAIAEAAFALARERGLDGFVVDDIVQLAGFSRRTFANYYACKEEAVAMAVMTHHDVDEAQAMLDAVPDDAGPIDVLRQLLKAQFTTELLRKMRELLALSNRHRVLEPYLLSVFRRMQIEGDELLNMLFRGRYPEGYSHMLIGAVYGAVMPIIDGRISVSLPGDRDDEAPDTVTFEQYLDTAFGYLRNGF